MFKERAAGPEIMDTAGLDYETTAEVYGEIRKVNRFLGGRRAVLKHLRQFLSPGVILKEPKATEGARSFASLRMTTSVRILDVASGAGDIPAAIVRWARRKKIPVRVTVFDLNPHALCYARKNFGDYPEIDFVRGDSFKLPFRDGSFDYVISSLFFHHLKEDEIIAALQSFDRIARRGIVVNDLVRSPAAYAGFLLFSSFSRSEIFRRDGALSVRRGFRRPEIEAMIRRSGLGYLKYYRHFAFRFAVAGEKTTGMSFPRKRESSSGSPIKTFGDDKERRLWNKVRS